MYFTLPFNFSELLRWMGTQVSPYSEYNFYYPNAEPANETEYLSWVEWDDERDQPSWEDIVEGQDDYSEYYYSQPALRSDVLALKALHDTEVADLQSQIDAILIALDGKVDK